MKKQTTTAGEAGRRTAGGNSGVGYTKKYAENQATEVGDLAEGQVILASARQVSHDESKCVLEFCEGIKRENQSINVLAEANDGDERFGSSVSVRRSWLTASIDNLEKMFGLTAEQVEEIKGGEITELMIENPTILAKDGKKYPLALQITHRVGARTDYEIANSQKAARQFPRKNGPTLYPVVRGKNGVPMLTFENITVVAKADREHSIINTSEADRITWEQYEEQTSGVQSVGSDYALNK